MSYINLRFTFLVGVIGSPSSSGSSIFGMMRNALICSTLARFLFAPATSASIILTTFGLVVRLAKPVNAMFCRTAQSETESNSISISAVKYFFPSP